MSKSVTLGVCQLCNQEHKLVDSHIVPRSFFGKHARNNPMIRVGTKQPQTFKKGMYGRFLCSNCEKNFSNVDNWAAKYLQQRKNQTEWIKGESSSEGALFFKTDQRDKEYLKLFASSLLFRAGASGLPEYSILQLDKYGEEIKSAWLNDNHTESLKNSLDISAALFLNDAETDEPSSLFNAAFESLVRCKVDKKMTQCQRGGFTVWRFGFPYGQIDIRVGGEQPEYGFVKSESNKKGVIWSSNISREFDHLFVPLVNKRSFQPDFQQKIISAYQRTYGSRSTKK